MLLERHETWFEDALRTTDGAVRLHVTDGVGHLLRLVTRGAA
jgi:hypothetical protein